MNLYNTSALPAVLYGSENWSIIATDSRRITAAEMKCMRKTAGHTRTDYKKKYTEITNELNITPVLGKIQNYRRSWLQHVNKMSRNGLPRIIKNYRPKGRRNKGRPLKRRPGLSTSGPTACQLRADDDDDDGR